MPDASSDSDTESNNGFMHTFDMPAHNATANELREVLKTAQLEMGKLMAENRELGTKLSVATEKHLGKQRPKGPDLHGYQAVIKNLGKEFGQMQEPWINIAAFTAPLVDGPPPHKTPEEIDAMFNSPKLYLQFITGSLYDHVPTKFHEIVDASTFPNFAENFIKHLNAGRSTAVNTLKANLQKILIDHKITSDTKALLYHPGENINGPPSAYPPIFYPGLKKNLQTRLLNPALPMALRCMVFGAGSISNRGTAKPLPNTLGYLWKLEGLTIGSVCFTLIVVIYLLSGVDSIFEEKGKVSKIPFQSYFRAYKKILMKTAHTAGVRNILRVWTRVVFAGVSSAVAIDDEVVGDDEAEAAEEAEFAAAMEGMTLGDDESGDDSDPNAVNQSNVEQRHDQPAEAAEPTGAADPVQLADVESDDNGAAVVPAVPARRGRGHRANTSSTAAPVAAAPKTKGRTRR